MLINYGKQNIDNSDVREVISALKSDKITQGAYVEKFENSLKKKFSSPYCVAVNNGTAALYLSLKSLNLKKNEKVICSPNTFFSSVYTIILNNLVPDFCDIELQTFNIDLNLLEHKIKRDKKIKAIVAVDFAGHPCDWKSLNFLKQKYNLKIINDNCHAIGAKINNDQGYAVKYSDLVTHSYHPVKNITSGEGGAVLTKNKFLFSSLYRNRNHGIIRDNNLMKNGRWLYEVKKFGFNFRLSDINAALGYSQLKRLNSFVAKRNKIAKIYNKSLSKYDYFQIPIIKKKFFHAFHLYPLLIDFKNLNINKNHFFNQMFKDGINLQVHYIPVYKQHFLRKYKFNKALFPNTEKYYSQEVSMPIYYSLRNNEIKYVIEKLKKNLKC